MTTYQIILFIFVVFFGSSYAEPINAVEQDIATSQNRLSSRPSFKLLKGTRVIENQLFTETLTINGKEWDGAVIRNNVFSGQSGVGLIVGNVHNLIIENNEFSRMKDKALKLKSDQVRGTYNIVIKNNNFHDIPEIALFVGEPNIGTQILNNRFRSVATDTSNSYPRNYPKHAIYVKGPDFLIEGNRISGVADSHGISVRSPGIVRGNFVENCAEYGIKYYSDSKAKGNGILIIENNVTVNNGSTGIGAAFSRKGLLINSMVIRFNTLVNNGKRGMKISENLDRSRIDFQIYGNIIVQSNKEYYSLGIAPSLMKENLTSPSDIGFVDLEGRDFRLSKKSPAINFIKDVPDVPPYDFSGKKMGKAPYDAGAYQYIGN